MSSKFPTTFPSALILADFGGMISIVEDIEKWLFFKRRNLTPVERFEGTLRDKHATRPESWPTG